jgi:hypothetical protein
MIARLQTPMRARRAALPPPCTMHPAAQATIAHWFDAMDEAALSGNSTGFAALVRMIADKVALEMQFGAD